MGKISILRVKLSAHTNPPDSETLAQFNNVLEDTLGYYDSVLCRWTLNNPGFFMIYTITQWNNTSSSGHNITYIRKNGGIITSSTFREKGTQTATNSCFYLGKNSSPSYYDIAYRSQDSVEVHQWNTQFYGIFIPDNYWKVKIGR